MVPESYNATEGIDTDVLQSYLAGEQTDDPTDTVYTILTTEKSVREFVSTIYTTITTPTQDNIPEITTDTTPTFKVLATKTALSRAFDDFHIASRAKQLTEDGPVDLRETDAAHMTTSAMFTDTHASLFLYTASFETTDHDPIDTLRTAFAEVWEDSPPATNRTAALNHMFTSMTEMFSHELTTTYRQLLEALDSVTGDGADEVRLSLVAGGCTGEELYEISKWGEDNGVASKATFSREKTKLEDIGIITTEKIPIEVGRPRLRLLLTADYRDLPLDELAHKVDEQL